MSYRSEKTGENSVQSVKSGDHEALNRELSDNELMLVVGGALTPEQAEEVRQLAKKAGEHHGINVAATIAGYTIGTFGDFFANTLGQRAGSQVNKNNQNNQNNKNN